MLAWISGGFPDLSSTNSDTGTGEMSLLSTSSLSRTEISPTVGEEGEDNEDEEEWLSCFKGVREVDEELDKPGTTIGTKFSVLQIIRIPSLMRCGFWPLIHSKEYPFSSQSFPSDNTAGVLSRTIPKPLTYTVASSCVSHFSIGGYDYRRTTRFCQSIHFSITQVFFFADHVHWRSGVNNKFSFLRFQRWCRHAPIFRRWEECCSLVLL